MLLAAIFSIAVVYAGPTIAEFPELTFETTVTATKSGKSCGISSSSPIAPTLTPCLPDPYEQICKTASAQVKKSTNDVLADIDELEAKVQDAKEAAAVAFVKERGPFPAKTDPKRGGFEFDFMIAMSDGGQAVRDKLWPRIESKLIKSKPQVKASIERAQKIFLKMLAKARTLGVHDQTVQQLMECTKNFELDHQDPTLSATLEQQYSPAKGEARFAAEALELSAKSSRPVLVTTRTKPGTEDNVHYNPALKQFSECKIKLSPTAWIECSQDSPSCYRRIFHEMGHRLNPCHYAEVALQEKHIDQIAPELKPQVVDLMKKSSVLMEQLSKHLEDPAYSCLGQISSPKDGIADACGVSPGDRHSERMDWFVQKCGYQNSYGHPSQWDEAVADLWGASAMAVYLEESAPGTQARAKMVTDTMATLCLYDQADKIRNSETRTTPGAKLIGQVFVKGKELGGCSFEATPAHGKSPAWRDAHQTLSTRVNRNWLRNSDMRRALGCDVNAEVPVSCSPLGELRTLMPSAKSPL